MSDDEVTLKRVAILAACVVFVIGGGLAGCMFGMPTYQVWEQGMKGKAEYARAESNRRIAELDAAAREATAKGEAAAVVIHADGEAEANRRIGASLDGQHGERRLRYLQIDAMRNHPGATIYIPTEAGLPIMEAGRDLRGRSREAGQ